ncbi:unnamed protein product [Callosobruchus maculatus]|uniref:TTF-type domain-containing protein n=1 Tax=Callosobruchus maculatus TaxID=64391 RepID=A0A653BUG7_CALMS|nr:unnamed protein product [Callosobruchus maculatus]
MTQYKSNSISVKAPDTDRHSIPNTKDKHRKGRKFLPKWSATYPWLQESEEKNGSAICTICTEAVTANLPLPADPGSQQTKEAFVSIGFSQWNHAHDTFKNHEKSKFHFASVQALHSMKKTKPVIQQLSDGKLKEMKEARIALRKIFESIIFLSKEGLPFRGSFHKEGSFEDSKFNELLKLRANDVPELDKWLKRSNQKWLHHSIVEEILKILSDSVLNGILQAVRNAKYYSIMVDETSDISRLEQVSLCLRHVDEKLNVTEDFVGFYETKNTKSETLFSIVKDVLTRYNLDLKDVRGQSFDGAANVSGDKIGLQTRIREENPLALFVHCVPHRLNLSVQDALTGIQSVRDFIGTVKQLITFVRDSPRRLDIFKNLQNEGSPALMKYCPTRWCVRIKSLKTVRDNYKPLMEFFGEILDDSSMDSTVTASASSYLYKLESFDFFFHLKALICIFERVETLNTVLQKIDLNLTESHAHVKRTMQSLQDCRNNDFPKFWLDVTTEANKIDLQLPSLPRIRKAPKRYDSHSSPHVFANPEELYRKLFFELLDLSVTSLDSRFQSSTIRLLNDFENFVVKTTQCPEKVISFYKTENFDADRLTLHRDMVYDLMKNNASKYGIPNSLADVVNYLKENLDVVNLVPELTKLIRILLTIPVSTCTCERSFSAMRRLKSYLRSTLKAERLNHFSILHIHRDLISEIDIEVLMDEFIGRAQGRINTFAR